MTKAGETWVEGDAVRYPDEVREMHHPSKATKKEAKTKRKAG
jgi:hypothetical protein